MSEQGLEGTEVRMDPEIEIGHVPGIKVRKEGVIIAVCQDIS